MAAAVSPQTQDLLTLTCIPGLGPTLIGRAVRSLGGAGEVVAASPAKLQTVPGIGPEKAKAFLEGRAKAAESAKRELERAAKAGASVIGLGEEGYPPLLAEIPDPPPVLYIRGRLEPEQDRYTVALVGSRQCSQYGREQTGRFAGLLASSGVTVVSGGARGIDTAAHRAALQAGGRTLVVLGCGVGRAYPPENAGLFDEIVSGGRGAVLSELPVETPPNAENFPGRNRIISGLSLGVLVIEAAKGSGSLITARMAVEDHGREVFAVPGRVDSAASEGTNELIKSGAAHLVTAPRDVLELLEAPARHLHAGTHEARYAQPGLFGGAAGPGGAGLSAQQQAVVDALESPLGVDDLAARTGLDAARLRAELTMLELRRVVVRDGGYFMRSRGG